MFSRQILPQEEAEKVVIDFTPQKFPMGIPEPADDFNKLQVASPSAFKMNEIIMERTGVAEKLRKEREEVVEQKALEKLKVLQEAAYKEAYDLGMDEGRKEAFAKNEQEIKDGIAKLTELIDTIEKLKKDLLIYNEAHIVKLLYYMASRIAMKEIAENTEAIVPVLQTVLESSQHEEEVTIKISTEDYEYLKDAERLLQLKIPGIDSARLEKVDGLKRGGCIIETNYGQVDATLEERLNRLWETVKQTAPKAKDRFES